MQHEEVVQAGSYAESPIQHEKMVQAESPIHGQRAVPWAGPIETGMLLRIALQ